MLRSTSAVPVFPGHGTTAHPVKVSGTMCRLTSPWMSLGSLFILVALGLAVGVHIAQGQEISFLREFSISGWDDASRVAVDATGVYVAGGGNGVSYVRKFDLSGNELWTHREPATEWGLAGGVAVDTTGVYVAWTAGHRGLLQKLDPSGNELWTRQSTGSVSYGNLAADSTGVYVVVGQGQFVLLYKYDSSGNELWKRQSTTGTHFAGVAADSTGVYLIGNTGGGSTNQGFVRKYTAGGDELWTNQFSGVNWATSVTTGSTGVYVAGASRLLPFLRKYDSSGKELWIREFDSSEVVRRGPDGHVEVRGVAVDLSGVYLVGTTTFALAGQCRSGFQDAFVRKYDTDGVPLWTRQFSGSSDYGAGNGVAVGATGVYMVGQSSGLAGSNAMLAKLEKTQPVVSESVPRIVPGCVVNAASDIGGKVSPGEIVTILGRGIGPPETTPLLLTEQSRLATTLAGTRILFNGVAAPLISVSSERAIALVPYAVAERPTVDVQIEYQGVLSNVVTMPVAVSRPGIFTVGSAGSGRAAALNEDGSINSSAKPAAIGSVIVLYATGEGLTEPVVEDGLVLGSMLPKPRSPVSVEFSCASPFFYSYYCYYRGSDSGEVLYAGGAPGLVAGVLQVNVRIPRDVGDQVKICVDNQCSESVRVFLKD